MIQRKQTLLFIFAFILSVLLFILPLADIKLTDLVLYKLCFFKLYNTEITALFMPYGNCILNTISLLLVFVTIFFYKKRNLQIRLCGLAILVNTTLLASIFFYADAYVSKFTTSGINSEINYTGWALIPVLNIILIYFALRFIKKDEMLVRAADRLR